MNTSHPRKSPTRSACRGARSSSRPSRFALLLFVLGKFVWPMFEKAFAARTKAIEGGIAKAEEAQNEAKAALDRYNQQLAGAREEAAKIREDARAQAQAIRDDMLATGARRDRADRRGRPRPAGRAAVADRRRAAGRPRPDVGRAGQQGRR